MKIPFAWGTTQAEVEFWETNTKASVIHVFYLWNFGFVSQVTPPSPQMTMFQVFEGWMKVCGT